MFKELMPFYKDKFSLLLYLRKFCPNKFFFIFINIENIDYYFKNII